MPVIENVRTSLDVFYAATGEAIMRALDWMFGVYQLKDGRVLRLLNDQVLIRLISPERMTAKKRLYIPDSAQRRPDELYTGVVLACGPGERGKINGVRKPIGVKPGDKILLYWVGAEVHVTALQDEDGNELRIVKESHIQGVLSA